MGCFRKPADADSLIPQNGWQVFPSQNIPSMFNYGHVYYYLVESIENNSENDEHDVEECGDDRGHHDSQAIKERTCLVGKWFYRKNTR